MDVNKCATDMSDASNCVACGEAVSKQSDFTCRIKNISKNPKDFKLCIDFKLGHFNVFIFKFKMGHFFNLLLLALACLNTQPTIIKCLKCLFF